MTFKSEQLEWRRGKVAELRSQGLTYTEISKELQVPRTAVAEDMLFLKKQAKASIREYVTEELPLQYKFCLIAMDKVIRKASTIMDNSDNDYDTREILQASELYKDTNITKLELLSDSTTIQQAMQFINSYKHREEKKGKGEEKGDHNASEKHTDTEEETVGDIAEEQSETG